MASAEQLRRYATECVRVAQQIDNPIDKATLLQMAKVWLNLAEMAEKTDSNRNGKP
jgi:hypothetical protein